MYDSAYMKITELAVQPDSLERATVYLQQNMQRFLRRGERVLICFAREAPIICGIFEEAVRRCNCIPMILGEDRRWKNILKTAFTYKCNAIIGTPMFVLSLAKLARYMGTPLYTRNVVLAGYPCVDWMAEGIQRELDCRVWGCFDPGAGSVVAGFSCEKSVGVHLRSEEYNVEIVDEAGNPVPDGTVGRMILSPKAYPDICFDTGDRGFLNSQICPCGCNTPRIMAINAGEGIESKLSRMGEEFHRWTSILDCRIEECGYGMELEMIVFPGEKLPKLPSFSKMVIRPWDPEKDEPFVHSNLMKKRLFSEESH